MKFDFIHFIICALKLPSSRLILSIMLSTSNFRALTSLSLIRAPSILSNSYLIIALFSSTTFLYNSLTSANLSTGDFTS